MAACMKLKTLEARLQELDSFTKPKILLEQYVTPPHIAALALHTIQTQHQALCGRRVLDAGCGPGTLAVGARLLGAAHVTAVDVDADALDVLRENVRDCGVDGVDAVLCDFLGPLVEGWDGHFDTVLMNPPFGTKHNAGADVAFLRRGLRLAGGDVYSMHKTSTRAHILKRVREWGAQGSVVAELRYDLPASYKFHRARSRDIAVDLWRVSHGEHQE